MSESTEPGPRNSGFAQRCENDAYIARAMETEGGHLSIGRGGATLHFERSRLSGCAEDFVKAVAKLCYFIHQKKQNPKPFRYHDLVPDSSDDTRTICKSIVMIKKSNWDAKLIESELLIFKGFVGRL